MGPLKFHTVLVGAVLAISLSAPAMAGYPGSTQPGAQPVPRGYIILLRDVPARNAIISGAGDALAVSPAPPSIVFDIIEGVGAPLTDAQEATVAGSIGSREGQIVSEAVGGVFGSQSMVSGAAPERSGASGAGSPGGALQTGLGALRTALGSIGGGGF